MATASSIGPMSGALNPMFGRKHTRRTRQLMSIKSSRFWAKKSNHVRMSKRVIAQWKDPEWAEAQRQRQLAGWERRRQRVLAQAQGGGDVQ